MSGVTWGWAGLLVALCLVLSTVSTLADDVTVAAGNGGTGDCAANGGALAAVDVNSGANVGAAIRAGDTRGSVDVGGGAMANLTGLDATLGGGTGVCDATGGDDNIAVKRDPTPTPRPVTTPPPPTPTPAPPVPMDDQEFLVCVSDGVSTICLPGSCDATQGGITCTIPADCSEIPGSPASPCVFEDCEVVGSRGECDIFAG